MHYVIDLIEGSFPDLLKFQDELSHVADGHKGTSLVFLTLSSFASARRTLPTQPPRCTLIMGVRVRTWYTVSMPALKQELAFLRAGVNALKSELDARKNDPVNSEDEFVPTMTVRVDASKHCMPCHVDAFRRD